MTHPLKLWQRVAIGLFVPTAILLICLHLYHGQTSLVCFFYERTGFYCAGCGSGRAVTALLHGQLRTAFSYNMLLFLLGIPAAAVFFHEYLRLVFPSLPLKPVYLSQPVAVGSLVLLVSFWVMRNIPALSFLAPAG